MARKKALTDLGDNELIEKLGEGKEEYFNLRFQLVTGELENHARIREVKKAIARLLTALRVREIEAAEARARGQDPGSLEAWPGRDHYGDRTDDS